jgi:hypothetical protein
LEVVELGEGEEHDGEVDGIDNIVEVIPFEATDDCLHQFY